MNKFDNGQISLEDFGHPVGMNPKNSNRWAKRAQTIPWIEIEKKYAKLFSNMKGKVAKSLRLGLGVRIIQAEEDLEVEGGYISVVFPQFQICIFSVDINIEKAAYSIKQPIFSIFCLNFPVSSPLRHPVCKQQL